MIDFPAFPKIARLSRNVVITEKIDGTNASVFIRDDRAVFFGSRTRWITLEDDNYGFARWGTDHIEDLLKLGPGHHFGEWWGLGIQRNYSMTRKVFSLFNTALWRDPAVRPACCDVVPTLYEGPFEEHGVMRGLKEALSLLKGSGSVAAPGFTSPEGVVVWHDAARVMFKKMLEKDEEPKGRG